MSRTAESLRNSVVSLIIQVGTLLLNFVARTILIKTMGEQYLGINGLFGNILNMLSLAELGVGSTITYWLYKPMAEKDEQRLNVLMAVYARIYNTIGLVILIVGIALAPFLSFFMKETPDIPQLTLIYVLYVINMAASYFFVYKSSLINVAQKNYIVNTIRFIFFVLVTIVQSIVLVLTKNYILYYLCTIASSVLGNIVISLKAEKMFPFLKERAKGRLTKEEVQEIKKDISAIFSHNIGSFVLTSTDNMIISKFIGVIEVGLYSNYTMLVHAVKRMIDLLFNSLTSSVGNLIFSVSKEKTYSVFKNIFFAISWIAGFCAVSFYTLLNPFITLWLGERYIFNKYVVFFIVLNFYLTAMRRPVNTFKQCAGLFRKDRYKPFIESVVNLVTSIYLAQKFGIAGVFMGTAISSITVCLYIEPYILYKYFYERNVLEYFKLFFKYVVVTFLAAVLIDRLSLWIKATTFISFLYQLFLCIMIPNLLFWMFFKNTSEMRYFKELLAKLLKKFLRRS